MIRARTISLGLFAVTAAMTLSPFAFAADAAREIETASIHAGYSAKAGSLEEARAHLHHALNCLVGPQGKGYDAGPGDPCKGQGNGAIADSTGNSKKDKLEEAAAAAREGIADKILSLSRAQAVRVQELLKQAQAM